jgi:nitrogen regulatory protein PII
MRKIEALVQAGGIGSIRDALREIGVRTLRVSELRPEAKSSGRSTAGRELNDNSQMDAMARVGVVVPDNLTDRVILTLLGKSRGDDGSSAGASLASIERVDAVEVSGFFDGIH